MMFGGFEPQDWHIASTSHKICNQIVTKKSTCWLVFIPCRPITEYPRFPLPHAHRRQLNLPALPRPAQTPAHHRFLSIHSRFANPCPHFERFLGVSEWLSPGIKNIPLQYARLPRYLICLGYVGHGNWQNSDNFLISLRNQAS